MTNAPPNLDMGEPQPSKSFASFMRRMAQIATQPGCWQITLVVDKGAPLRYAVQFIGKMEGV